LVSPRMIEFIIVFNRQGKLRASRWYKPFTEVERRRVVNEINRLVALRDSKDYANFITFNQKTLVYRRYASLYFAMLIDPEDNALSALVGIHFLVETLDRYFQNVCELDLVFNFWKAIQLMDEIFLAGELVESSKQVVLERMILLDRNNKDPVASSKAKEARDQRNKERKLKKDKEKEKSPKPGKE